MNKLNPKAIWLLFRDYLVVVSFSLPLFIIISIAIAGGLLQLNYSYILLIIFLIIIALIILAYFLAKLSYNNFCYMLKDESYYQESGIIFKHYLSIPYDRIQSVDIKQGPIGRFLGISSIYILTAGSSGYGQYMSAIQGRIQGIAENEAVELRNQIIKKAKESRKSTI